MKLKSTDVLCAAAILAIGALAVYLYPLMSDPMPIHWNLDGAADGYARKPFGVLISVAVPVLIYGLFKLLPLISPRGFEMRRFQHVTDILAAALTISMAAMSAIALLTAAGVNLPRSMLMALLLGGLLVVIGNYLAKVRKNFFVGIRTPWTLASDEVWARTHRLGGRLFFLAGVAVITSSAYPSTFPAVALSAIGIAAVVSVLYSLLLYLKLYGVDDGKRGS